MKPSKPAARMTIDELASYIDYSILKPEFTIQEVQDEIAKAADLKCKTICIDPASLEDAAPMVEGTDTGICVVVDFPFGASTTASKVAQTEIALEYPLEDLDVVANYGWIRSGENDKVTEDLKPVIDACHAKGITVKVIFETDALTEEQIRAAAESAVAAGADYIKTSTGFYTGRLQHGERSGAFDGVVDLMQDAAASRCKVKGSGAIRDRAHFLRLIDEGIDRMGVGYRSVPTILGLD